jgi:6,7-dimethyl-8-ribityllumazine synthase
MRYDDAEADNSQYPTVSSETQQWNGARAGDLAFAVVVARYNREVTARLLEGARTALAETGAGRVDVFEVPGAFELPLAALRLARRGDYHAIVALGCVIRGGTPHFGYVAGEAARGLQQVAIDTATPVAFGVLTTDTPEQAMERAGGALGNKGYDAAMTAVEMARFAR